MRKIICMLCAAAMAVTLFGCKPDSGDVNSKAVLSNSSAESIAEVSSETESSAENDSTDSSIESDLTESDTDETSFSNESLPSQASLLPEKIESMEIKCSDTHEGKRLILFINGEETKAPVKWSSNNEMFKSIDLNGKITRNYTYKDRDVIFTATLSNGMTATYEEYNVPGYQGAVQPFQDEHPRDEAYLLDIYPEDENSEYCNNISVSLSDNSMCLQHKACFARKYYYIVTDPIAEEGYFTFDVSDGIRWSSCYMCDFVYHDYEGYSINWTSSDDSIASVNDKGVVTFHKKGRVLITASMKDQIDGQVFSDKQVSDYIYVNVE